MSESLEDVDDQRLIWQVPAPLGEEIAGRWRRLNSEIERIKAERDARPAVCVAVVIEDDLGCILLLKRGPSCSWPGQWCLPGGRLDHGETLFECCRREVREETGLELLGAQFSAVTEMAGPPHLVGLVYRGSVKPGEPVNAEPEKHDAMGWFARLRLPSPLMPGTVQWLMLSGEDWEVDEKAEGGGQP